METNITESKGLQKQADLKTFDKAHMSSGMPAPRVIQGTVGSNMSRTAGISKTAFMGAMSGGGDVTTQPTFWYSPEMQPDSWLLPKSRIETLRFCQIYFNLDPYINSIIRMHASYAFSRFYLQCKDPNVTALFNKLLFNNQDFDWYDFTLQMALSYYKYGEACLTGDTQIRLGDGSTATIKELYDKQTKDFTVVAAGEIDSNGTRAFYKCKADCVVLTKKDADIVNVTLSNNTHVRCTPDHKFLHADGIRFINAEDLKPGTPLAFYAPYMEPEYCKSELHVIAVEPCGKEDVYDIHDVEEFHNFALANGAFVHNCVWGAWNAARRTWDRFTLLHPAIVEYKEDMVTGHATMELIPTNEMKRIVKDALLQGRQDLDPMLLNAIENNKKLPLDTEGIPENEFTGQDYVPPKVFMWQRKTDPSSERGTSAIECLFKDLIYKDQLRLSQLAVAQKTQLPIELWTVGHIGNDDESSMLPGPELLEEVRQMITQATQQPPFSIVYGPYLKYEALGVSGKLLDIYNDLGYVENQILVGLGVNKAVILGEGPSVQGKAISLNKLIREYAVVRDLFSNWFKRNILLPIAKANRLVDEDGQYIIPEIIWEQSLQPESDKEVFDMFYKMWKDGLVSTMTLFEKCPKKIDYTLEMQRLTEERATVFNKYDKRLGKQENTAGGAAGGAGGAGGGAGGGGAVEEGKGNPELIDFALGGGAAEGEELPTEIPDGTEGAEEAAPVEG